MSDSEKIDNLKKPTPAQFNKAVDRGLQEMQDRIKFLSKNVMGAQTVSSGMLGQTRMGLETQSDYKKQLEKLEKDFEEAKADSALAKQNYPKVYKTDDFPLLSREPDKAVQRWPYSSVLTRPQRGRKASSSQEKD